jgi:hypothetical protein
LPQDAFIPVDTTAARTINLPASPATGQKHTIKDANSLASTNNILVMPASGNIDNASSFTINNNDGSATFVYGGSQWFIQ